jgi:hypothetical protein
LIDLITAGLKIEIGTIFDEEMKEAVKRTMERRDDLIASQALKLTSQMTVADMGRTVRIEIVKPEEK